MDMVMFINNFLFPFIEGFILFYGFLYLIDKPNFLKEKKVRTIICLTAYDSFCYWSTMHIEHSFHTLLIVIFTICLFAFITGSNLYMSIIHMSIMFLAYGLIEVTVSLLIVNIARIPLEYATGNPLMKLRSLSIILPIQFTAFFSLSHTAIRNYLPKPRTFSKENHTISYMLLQLIAMLIFFISTTIKVSNSILSLTVLGIIYISTAILGVLDFRERIKTMDIEKQFSLQKEHIKNMELVIDAIRKEKHDYANHISTLIAMCMLKEPDTLDRVEFYAKRLIKDMNSKINYKFYDTGNKYLDGFLTVKNNKAVENGIYFDVDFDAPLSQIAIDEINLTSIIGNIIDNAFDAVLSNTEGGKKRIVSLYSYVEDNRYCISISNNGPKIPEIYLKKIFENKFTTKSKEYGERGFGLFIVKELLAQNNGRISVLSSEEETEFLIEFEIENQTDKPSSPAA